ncbi:uncharacterized protein LOC117175810 [Belonocnema kinseyi]|uniref:uncharacterized protein LOC117175810 n=1 Tax=Belonocnema kinseyi TaxID=2817044 RepID=UPI00143D944B|nr:uncharacterized protein LOC117175810 [Belonocnema kinseyi]
MELLGILVLTLLIPVSHPNNEDSGYRVTPFQNSIGVYFEYLTPMKRITGTCRIVTFLQLDKVHEALIGYQIRYKNLPKFCQPLMGYGCDSAIKEYHVNAKFDTAENYQKQIKEEMCDLSHNFKKEYPPRLTSGMRVRRTAPMLGFIGGIFGPVAGLLNYDDGQRIEAEIDNMSQAASNLTHLMGKQTHILRAQMDKIHSRSKQLEKEQEIMRGELTQMLYKTKQADQAMYTLNVAEMLQNMLHSLEVGLNEYIRSATELLDVIHYVRDRKLNPAHLTSDQLKPIYRDVQDHARDWEFPLPGPKVSTKDLATIAKVMVICKNGTIRILLDIPLIERTEFSVYRIHPLPVDQSIPLNKASRACVHSEHTHIAMENLQRTYILFYLNKKESCNVFFDKYIFYINSPIYESARRSSCESQLLIQPTIDGLKFCDARITHKTVSTWIHLETLGAWLYSLVAEIIALVKCPAQKDTSIQLTGTRLMPLAPGCVMRMRDITLPASPLTRGTSEMIYEPTLSLDLLQLSSVISQHQNHSFEGFQIAKAPSYKDEDFEENEQTLDQLEIQLYEASMQRHARRHIVSSTSRGLCWHGTAISWTDDCLLPLKLLAIITTIISCLRTNTPSSFHPRTEESTNRISIPLTNMKTSARNQQPHQHVLKRTTSMHASSQTPSVTPRTSTNVINNENGKDAGIINKPCEVVKIPIQRL